MLGNIVRDVAAMFGVQMTPTVMAVLVFGLLPSWPSPRSRPTTAPAWPASASTRPPGSAARPASASPQEALSLVAKNPVGQIVVEGRGSLRIRRPLARHALRPPPELPRRRPAPPACGADPGAGRGDSGSREREQGAGERHGGVALWIWAPVARLGASAGAAQSRPWRRRSFWGGLAIPACAPLRDAVASPHPCFNLGPQDGRRRRAPHVPPDVLRAPPHLLRRRGSAPR
jgi:hypothetical protein